MVSFELWALPRFQKVVDREIRKALRFSTVQRENFLKFSLVQREILNLLQYTGR